MRIPPTEKAFIAAISPIWLWSKGMATKRAENYWRLEIGNWKLEIGDSLEQISNLQLPTSNFQ
jgi:hypothetical protein